MKHVALFLVALAIIVVLGIWLVIRDKDGNEIARVQVPEGGSTTVSTEPNAPPKPSATGDYRVSLKFVAVRVVKKSLVRTTELPGKIAPMEETPLVAKVAGYVETVKADIGDPIKKGSPLAVLRAPELVEDVEQKKASAAAAQSGIAQAEAGVAVAEATRDKAKTLQAELDAGVTAAKATLKFRRSERDRVVELTKSGSLTESRRDEAESQYQAAAAAVDEAKAKLGSAAAGVAEAEARIVQAKADHAAAISQKEVADRAVKRAAAMIDYLTITAPFDGFVTARSVDTGHFVAPADSNQAKPMFVVVRANQVRVFVDVPEYDAQFVAAGDKATVRVQSLGDKTFADAAVTRTALNLDPQAGTLRTEIDLDNPQGEIRPGMYAVVSIELARRDGALVVPTSAIFAKDGKSYVVAIAGGKADVREVKRGLSAGAETEITDGLDEGDLVVQKNAATITAGQAIEGVESK